MGAVAGTVAVIAAAAVAGGALALLERALDRLGALDALVGWMDKPRGGLLWGEGDEGER